MKHYRAAMRCNNKKNYWGTYWKYGRVPGNKSVIIQVKIKWGENMADIANLKEQLKEYGITNERELDAALKRNLAELDIGIMTSPITSAIEGDKEAV